MQIFLIRHTSVNIESGTCYGQSDVDVSDQFQNEAEFIKQSLSNENFDAIYSSPSTRCLKLAEFCTLQSIIKDERLMEMNFGVWELKKWDEITDPQLTNWYNDWIHTSPTQGESLIKMVGRVKSFIIDLQLTKHKKVAIFTHAGVIRCFESIINEINLNDIFQSDIKFGCIKKINL